MNESFYPAKLLLFGEYTIISNSLALAIPLHIFGGRWSVEIDRKDVSKMEESKAGIQQLYKYLYKMEAEGQLKNSLNWVELQNDLSKGLWFDSNIPHGYGLGSSGALCAAIAKSYAPVEEDPTALRAFLAQMEGFFHGESSGIDPLVSYIGQALLIRNRDKTEILKDFVLGRQNNGAAIFLLDTRISRRTPPLVKHYLQKVEKKGFVQNFVQPISDMVEEVIDIFLKKGIGESLSTIAKISSLQADYMHEFIPPAFRELWRRGLDSGDFYLKLCGAGGGGFILGFCKNWELAQLSINTLFPHSVLYQI